MNIVLKSSVVLVFSALLVAVYSAKFPAKWKKCPKTNNEECLKIAVMEAVVDLKNGNKELHVIPLDPLHFNQLIVNQGSSSPVNINLTFTDLDVFGPSQGKINWVKADWDNYFLQADIEILNGPVKLKANYEINGKVLVLPINGHGKSEISIDECSVQITLRGKEMVKKGKKYFDADFGELILKGKKVHFYFENLFNGQKELGDNMNKFLNENWQDIMNELNGTIAKALGLGVKEVANSFFHRIPVTELYT